MKRLVLLGEGEGDLQSLVILTKKVLQTMKPWESLFLDANPLRLGDLPGLLNENTRGEHDRGKWLSRLRQAALRPRIGGMLVVLDGDAKRRTLKAEFCAAKHARQLVVSARSIGAGSKFSLAVVFARQEFESWLIASVTSLAGKPFKGGLSGIPANIQPPEGDLEVSPRDAKRWLSEHSETKYKPARDQAQLTNSVDLALIRQRNMRSFLRLEHAIQELVSAFSSDQPIATPS